MPCTSQSSWFNHPGYIRWMVQTMSSFNMFSNTWVIKYVNHHHHHHCQLVWIHYGLMRAFFESSQASSTFWSIWQNLICCLPGPTLSSCSFNMGSEAHSICNLSYLILNSPSCWCNLFQKKQGPRDWVREQYNSHITYGGSLSRFR